MARTNIAVGVVTALATLGVGSTMAQTAGAPKPATDSEHEQHHQSTQSLSDAEFVPMMIKHHREGIQMAQLEEKTGGSAEVKALATRIRQSQQRDIPELERHAKPAGTSGSQAGHDKAMEQQSQATMTRLKSSSGAALDHAFLEEMAKHHEMAIQMSETAKLQDPELKRQAQQMVASQRKELAELKQHLAQHGPAK